MKKKNFSRLLKPLLLLFIALSLLTSCTVAAVMIVSSMIDVDSKYYATKIATKLSNQQRVAAGDVFEFEFHKAYILADDYISGDELVSRYDLNVSISEVTEEDSDLVGRIIFVDEEGNFVFNFTYMKQDLHFEKTGLVIYPDTLIKRVGGATQVMADSTEYYYRSIDSERFTAAISERAAARESVSANSIFEPGAIRFYEARVAKANFPEYDDKIIFYDEDGLILYEYIYDSKKIDFRAEHNLFYSDDTVNAIPNSLDGTIFVSFTH